MSETGFKLHEQLEKDTVKIGDLPLCELLLINDANYPWCVLVPRRAEITEVYQLNQADRAQLLEESCVLSEVMQQVFSAKKMNVAALGNMVPQLHLHHIARFEEDNAWPGPIWGVVPAKAYENSALQERVEVIQQAVLKADLDLSV